MIFSLEALPEALRAVLKVLHVKASGAHNMKLLKCHMQKAHGRKNSASKETDGRVLPMQTRRVPRSQVYPKIPTLWRKKRMRRRVRGGVGMQVAACGICRGRRGDGDQYNVFACWMKE